MESLVAGRDGAVLTLSFSAVHVGLNVLSTDDVAPRCPYDELGGFLMSLGTFLLFAFAALAPLWPPARRFQTSIPHVRDAIGIVPGIWFQITTKPDGFFAGVPVESCDMRASGYAMALWILGEMLTFGAALRLGQAWGFGRRLAPTVGIVLGALALQGLVGMAADALSRQYAA